MAQTKPAAVKRKREPADTPWQTHVVGSALRTLLQHVEARIGLYPRPDAFDKDNRFQGAVLLPPNVAIPLEFGNLFPEELAELQRLGKAVDRCHTGQMEGSRIYCLPYFSFDGFNALLALEQDGRVAAAWKDCEAFQGFSPQAIHTRIEFSSLDDLLLGALKSSD
jgi:hypothetical protein